MKRIRLSWALTGLVIVIVIGGCSGSDGTKRSEPAANGGAVVGTGGAGANLKADGDFVHDVANKSLAEMELSRMASEKAASPEIKAFAQMLLHEHDAAHAKLRNLVSTHALEWPAQLDDKYRDILDDLAKKQGPEFDREYAKTMVESHQDLAAKLESRLDVQSVADWKTAAAGRTQSRTLPEPKVEMTDVQVRPIKSDREITNKINQWSAETYPVAQKHLDAARTLENLTKRRSTD